MSNHGVTANTPDHLLLGPGELFYGYTSPESPGTSFGSTKGGSVWDLNRTLSDDRPDGAKGPVKGFRRVQEVIATLKVNLWELTAENLARMIAGASESTGEVTGGEGADESYIEKLALIAQTLDGRDAIIVLDNALPDGNLSLSLGDKEKPSPQVTFTAHFDPADLDTEPWSVYVEPAGS
jgi:hypothetical protein